MEQQPKRNLTLLYLLIFVCAIALIFWVFRTTPTTKTTEHSHQPGRHDVAG